MTTIQPGAHAVYFGSNSTATRALDQVLSPKTTSVTVSNAIKALRAAGYEVVETDTGHRTGRLEATQGGQCIPLPYNDRAFRGSQLDALKRKVAETSL